MTKIFVVEQALGCKARLTAYEVHKETPSFYVVNGGSKQIKRFAAGRRIFPTEEQAVAYLRLCCERELETAQRTTRRMQWLLAQDFATISKFARDDDAVCLEADRAAHAET